MFSKRLQWSELCDVGTSYRDPLSWSEICDVGASYRPATSMGRGGYGSLTWLAYKNMVPTAAQLTLEEEPPRLCIDMESERKLQNQRKFAMYVGGPSVFVAGSKVGGLFGGFVMALGAACTAWHYTAYRKVAEVTGVK